MLSKSFNFQVLYKLLNSFNIDSMSQTDMSSTQSGHFKAPLQNCEKRLLASSYLSPCLSVRPSA